jgi:hypothetical protein
MMSLQAGEPWRRLTSSWPINRRFKAHRSRRFGLGAVMLSKAACLSTTSRSTDRFYPLVLPPRIGAAAHEVTARGARVADLQERGIPAVYGDVAVPGVAAPALGPVSRSAGCLLPACRGR